LARLQPQFLASGAEILVILGDTLEKAREYASLSNAGYPVLADPQREVYLSYELEKYFSLWQRTASLVIDRNGIVRYIKRTSNVMTWLQESRELYGFVDSMSDNG
jgi:peroxiredoxin